MIMISMRRLLSLFRVHKYRFYSLIILSLTFTYFLNKWNIFCINFEARQQAKKMCKYYEEQKAVGSLCAPVCLSTETKSPTCHTFGSTKEAVFSLDVKKHHLVFKSAPTDVKPLHWFENGVLRYPSEKDFFSIIQSLVKKRLNLNLPTNSVFRLTRLNTSSEEKDSPKRQKEMSNIWILVHNNEYLLSTLYSYKDIFPQLIGTCGTFFAVEYLEPLQEVSSVITHTDNKETFMKRVRTSIQILELLEELETGFQEPFYLCDVKVHHFGLVPATNKMKLIDLDGIFPRSVINKILSSSKSCKRDDDCDVYDCRSRCLKTHKCANFVGNNNLQIVCEKIFLGWKLSSRIIIPGLLISEHTPEELAFLLRQCASPQNEGGKVRSAPDKDIRDRLHNILIQIEENASNDLLYQI